MKPLHLLLSVLIIACNGTASNNEMKSEADKRATSLVYKPGLGEFMSSIQVHHAKLWFAGINQNWKLADVEMHEIGETLDDIRQFNTDRPEPKSLAMIDGPYDR